MCREVSPDQSYLVTTHYFFILDHGFKPATNKRYDVVSKGIWSGSLVIGVGKKQECISSAFQQLKFKEGLEFVCLFICLFLV